MNTSNGIGVVNMDFILIYMFDIYVWLSLTDHDVHSLQVRLERKTWENCLLRKMKKS